MPGVDLPEFTARISRGKDPHSGEVDKPAQDGESMSSAICLLSDFERWFKVTS